MRSTDPVVTVPGSAGPLETGLSTERVLFGHLRTEDAASAVARRLRTAIGLGVILPGARLPKEADLAQQLGVTAFSLREALSTLREEGLIVTRVGKNGGSFVQEPPPSDAMAAAELARLTSSELRDLGDWQVGVTAQAARLAALRGSAGVAGDLEERAANLVAADDASTARKALGRFQVELAAATQSIRLTKAQLAAHEEFDWLMQALLRDQEQRAILAGFMRRVAGAVRAQDPEGAWRAAAQLVSHGVVELMHTRLGLIAEMAPTTGGNDLSTELRHVTDQMVGRLETIAKDLADVLASSSGDRLRRAVVAAILPAVGTADELVHGLGMMAEVGLVPERPHWIEWWQRDADGTFDRDYSHQLDIHRDDFYDYATKPFMTQPRASRGPSAVGPYIDHGGVDDSLVTVSVPILRDDAFLGIMAADIRTVTLERRLAPWLAQADGTCVVVNPESRVLLSNSVAHTVGDVLPQAVAEAGTSVGRFGWAVVTDTKTPLLRPSV